MPRVAKPANRCQCGCKQSDHAHTRQRLCECDRCGRKVRETREWLAKGALVCPCGGTLEPVCLFDRACLPGEAGELAYREWATKDAIHGVLSDRSRKGAAKGARTRANRRRLAVIDANMPF